MYWEGGREGKERGREGERGEDGRKNKKSEMLESVFCAYLEVGLRNGCWFC